MPRKEQNRPKIRGSAKKNMNNLIATLLLLTTILAMALAGPKTQLPIPAKGNIQIYNADIPLEIKNSDDDFFSNGATRKSEPKEVRGINWQLHASTHNGLLRLELHMVEPPQDAVYDITVVYRLSVRVRKSSLNVWQQVDKGSNRYYRLKKGHSGQIGVHPDYKKKLAVRDLLNAQNGYLVNDTILKLKAEFTIESMQPETMPKLAIDDQKHNREIIQEEHKKPSHEASSSSSSSHRRPHQQPTNLLVGLQYNEQPFANHILLVIPNFPGLLTSEEKFITPLNAVSFPPRIEFDLEWVLKATSTPENLGYINFTLIAHTHHKIRSLLATNAHLVNPLPRFKFDVEYQISILHTSGVAEKNYHTHGSDFIWYNAKTQEEPSEFKLWPIPVEHLLKTANGFLHDDNKVLKIRADFVIHRQVYSI